jgi:uncharacterized protein involved in cysteine biosynthesis
MAGPLFWTAALYIGIAFAGYLLFVPWLASGLDRLGVGAAATPLYLIVWILLSGITFLPVATLLGSFVWDQLSQEVEQLVAGSCPISPFSRREMTRDAVGRFLFGLLLSLLAVMAGFCLPVLGPLLVSGYVGMLDFTAPSMTRRGFLLRTQRSGLRRLRGSIGFFAIAGLLTLIPIVNVITFPLMVAAGSIMVLRSHPTPPRGEHVLSQ